MQAIQIKVIPETDHRPRRLKAWCYGGKIVECRDYSTGPGLQAKDLALKLAFSLNWRVEDFCMGQLCNGDWVMTFKGRDC